jgi:hypothetical protein
MDSSKKKHSFILKNIDVDAINLKYGLILISNIEKEASISGDKTRISDILEPEIDASISFLDENKREYDCIATMVDISSSEFLVPKTNICCFWCRHSFGYKPIGCPVKFINSSIEKSYISQITKDEYHMKENITRLKLNRLLSNKDKIIPNGISILSTEKEYYLTDGIFCSFNCTLSFINDNNKDLFYRDSISLLHSLYEKFTGKKILKIIPAPHWRLLKNYGGHMSIDEFRKNFNSVEYDHVFNVHMKSISHIYKKL